MADTSLRILVFGKHGCPKCKVLNKRIESLLKKDQWQDFEKQYCDIETEEGLVKFCKAECINPSRIPAFVVMRQDSDSEEYKPVSTIAPGCPDDVTGASKLYTYVGLQTDYSGTGKGVITPKMITRVLEEARAS